MSTLSIPIVLIALALLVGTSIVKPVHTAYFLAFMTAAFPKAGVKVGGFPFPVFLFGLVIAVLILWIVRKKQEQSPFALLVFFAYILWVVIRVVWLSSQGVETGQVFAVFAWTMIPMVLLFMATSITPAEKKFGLWLERGYLVAAAFGLVQLLMGIENTKIPGLTIAFGDSYDGKNNLIYDAANGNFSKIPSTYQNGNIFGVVSAFFLVVAIYRLSKGMWNKHQLILAGSAALMLGISGSRTAILVAGIIVLALALVQLRPTLSLTLVGLLIGAFLLLTVISPGLAERYSLSNLLNSGGAGRAGLWQNTIDALSFPQWFFGSNSYVSTEGWAGIVEQIGLVGICLLVLGVVLQTGGMPGRWYVLALLVISAVLDSSYQLFPTWFIPAAFAASVTRYSSRLDSEQITTANNVDSKAMLRLSMRA